MRSRSLRARKGGVTFARMSTESTELINGKTSAQIAKELAAPFHPRDIEWRIGSMKKDDPSRGMALAYIDVRAVRRRLTEVVGIDNWQAEPIAIGDHQIAYRIGIRFPHGWVWKGDGAWIGNLTPAVGDRGKVDQKEEQRLDMEGKGAFSTAQKRAGATWGIGEYLYEAPSPWVDIDPKWKSLTREAERYLDGVAMELYKKFGGGAEPPPRPQAPEQPRDPQAQRGPAPTDGERRGPPAQGQRGSSAPREGAPRTTSTGAGAPAGDRAPAARAPSGGGAPPPQGAPTSASVPLQALPHVTNMNDARDAKMLGGIRNPFKAGTPEHEAVEDSFATNAIRLMDAASDPGGGDLMPVGEILDGRFPKGSPRYTRCSEAWSKNAKRLGVVTKKKTAAPAGRGR